MAKRRTNKDQYKGMDAPRKIKLYLEFKGFAYRDLAAIMGTTTATINLWMQCHSRPHRWMQEVLHYLTAKDMAEPVKREDWDTDLEKEKIETAKSAIRRARRQHVVPPPSAMDRIKGRL